MSDDLWRGLKELLASQGIAAGEASLVPCREAGNNQVIRVDLPDRRLIAKRYFRSVRDPRDRLGAEWSLLSYADSLGLTAAPRPVARDEGRGLALYEFIEGRKLQPGEVGREAVEAAVAFFRALNGEERRGPGTSLPVASEACFSIADHLALVDRRVERLSAIQETGEIDREALALVNRLREHWVAIRRHTAEAAGSLGTALSAALSPGQRCVSPSDFGFHNALLRPEGTLCFIDFEYAGWDDPAKMAADFFCQPALPVDMCHFEPFLEGAMAFSQEAEELRARARLLLPAYRVKWSCIMLNDFLPDSAERRSFANPDIDILARKRAQLAKTERALQTLGA